MNAAHLPVGGEAAVLGTLPSEDQLKQIKVFRASLAETEEYKMHQPEAESYVNDDLVLHRFLCARKYDQKKTADMFRKHLTWRFGVYRPFEIRCEEVEPYARTGGIQVSVILPARSAVFQNYLDRCRHMVWTHGIDP